MRLDLGRLRVGPRCAARVAPRALVLEVPADPVVLDVAVDQQRRREHGVGVGRAAQHDAELGLDAADLGDGHGGSLPTPRRQSIQVCPASYRYCPVVTRSICRPPVDSSPLFSNVRTNTMRSPFLPEIFAQSSGLVVL